jgi:hypothetical protein
MLQPRYIFDERELTAPNDDAISVTQCRRRVRNDGLARHDGSVRRPSVSHMPSAVDQFKTSVMTGHALIIELNVRVPAAPNFEIGSPKNHDAVLRRGRAEQALLTRLIGHSVI